VSVDQYIQVSLAVFVPTISTLSALLTELRRIQKTIQEASILETLRLLCRRHEFIYFDVIIVC